MPLRNYLLTYSLLPAEMVVSAVTHGIQSRLVIILKTDAYTANRTVKTYTTYIT